MGVYVCPLHKDIRLSDGGKCPKCGMTLVLEEARFPLLQHIADNPVMLALVVTIVFAGMDAAMMLIG